MSDLVGKRLSDAELETQSREMARTVTGSFWTMVEGCLVSRCRRPDELSKEDKQIWLQIGLALSPLLGTCPQYSIDVILAWTLIGEWTSRVLFPVPRDLWPRHAHAQNILYPYHKRSPNLTGWASML